MRVLVAAALAVCGITLLPAPAAAAPIFLGTFTYNGFTAGTDNTCAECSAVAKFTLLDSDTFKIDLWNTSTYAIGDLNGGNIITKLGVNTAPNVEYKPGTANFFGQTGWDIVSTGGQFTFRAATTSGQNLALDPGDSLSVTFDFTSAVTSFAILSSQVHWQQTGLRNEDSDKGFGNPVPEPGSMMLLASGIAMAARSIRRRRRD